ncbi:hypothetical protein ACCC84_21570 [Serratia odorifera]|uniref:hypothetical protein n=1 Tax=Serratia odorifera TaxID=618 RepID=UPI0035324CAF
MTLSNGNVMFKNEHIAIKLLKECKGNIIVVGKSGAGKNSLINRVYFESVETIDVCGVMKKYPCDYVLTDSGFDLLKLDTCAAEVVILDKVNISDARLFKTSKLYDFIRLAGNRGQRIIVLTQSEINPAVAICFDGMISITPMDEKLSESPMKKKQTQTLH